MQRKMKLAAAGATLAVAAGAAGVATAVGADGESEQSATGAEAGRAKAAALKLTGGGKANQVERDNENGATWEVEVTKPSGDTVDVRLDGSYGKVAIESDHQDKGGDSGTDE